VYISGIETTIISILSCSFSGTGTSVSQQTEGKGGALYIDARTAFVQVVIDSTTFENTYARTQGGAIYIESTIKGLWVTIKNSIFKNNYAP